MTEIVGVFSSRQSMILQRNVPGGKTVTVGINSA